MKVLVTGATSGLGRNAAQWLLEHGHQVHAVGRNEAAGAELQSLGATFSAMDLAQAGAEDFAALVEGVDWVWHCAGLSSLWGKWEDFLKVNVVVTQNLAQAAGRARVQRFVYISTSAVYFDFQNRQDIPESFNATTLVNSYASSKAKAESEVVLAQQGFMDTQFVILRPRGIFGPHDRSWLPRVLQQIRKDRGVLKLPRGGEAFVDLTYVLNVVYAMFLASTRLGLAPAAVFNVTNQQPAALSVLLMQLLHGAMGVDFSIKPVSYQMLNGLAAGKELMSKLTGKEPGLTRYSVGALNFDMTLSFKKAREELGYVPLFTQEAAMSQTAAWFRTHAMEPGQGEVEQLEFDGQGK